MRSTFSILFYLKKNAVKSNGKAPIMARITVDGTKATFSCKISVEPDMWENGEAKGKSEDAKKINLFLKNIWKGCKQHYDQMINHENYANAEKVRNAYLGLDNKCNTILQVLKRHNDEFNSMVESKSRSERTYTKYVTVYNHLKQFIKYKYNRSDLALKELQPAFIKDFDLFLRTQKKCSHNTVWVYMMPLTMCIEISINNGWLSRNPFFEYAISMEETDRTFLTKDEIFTLMNYPIKRKSLQLVRDMYIFCVFTGLSYIDIKTVTKNEYVTFFDQNKWILKRREKTNIESNVRMMNIPLKIIEKWGSFASDTKLLPVPHYITCNNGIKKIAEKCGINKHLTWHSSRHTFATEICLNNKMPIETLSKTLGHKHISTTQIYGKITNERASDDYKDLTLKIDSIKEYSSFLEEVL